MESLNTSNFENNEKIKFLQSKIAEKSKNLKEQREKTKKLKNEIIEIKKNQMNELKESAEKIENMEKKLINFSPFFSNTNSNQNLRFLFTKLFSKYI